jgi:carbon storage regulator
MLVLTRRTNEKIVVGDSIQITVLETGKNEVVLAVEAPAENTIHRGEKLPDRGGQKAGS